MSLTVETAETLGFRPKFLKPYDDFVRDNLGVKHGEEEQFLVGLATGTGIDLIWANSPNLQTLDPISLEHYHAGLALFMLKNPFATGLGAALIGADVLGAIQNPSNAFGLGEPEPNRTINLAVGMTEIGILAIQSLWKK
jgi:hypothetical protein